MNKNVQSQKIHNKDTEKSYIACKYIAENYKILKKDS